MADESTPPTSPPICDNLIDWQPWKSWHTMPQDRAKRQPSPSRQPETANGVDTMRRRSASLDAKRHQLDFSRMPAGPDAQ
jgi:hypothetical protein